MGEKWIKKNRNRRSDKIQTREEKKKKKEDLGNKWEENVWRENNVERKIFPHVLFSFFKPENEKEFCQLIQTNFLLLK